MRNFKRTDNKFWEMQGNGRPIRVVVADDHPVVRGMVRSALEQHPDFEVCGYLLPEDPSALAERMLPPLQALAIEHRISRVLTIEAPPSEPANTNQIGETDERDGYQSVRPDPHDPLGHRPH